MVLLPVAVLLFIIVFERMLLFIVELFDIEELLIEFAMLPAAFDIVLAALPIVLAALPIVFDIVFDMVFDIVFEFIMFEFIILLAFALLLVFAASPQAIPSAPNANTPERAIIFFILFKSLLSSSKINIIYRSP